jgi:ribosomal protein S19E (S16A)
MNDYIVLVEQDLAKPRLARFVDTTSEKERRPVVDVFFAKKDEVLIFGRQHYLAVNIPAQGSPFLDE